MIGHPLDRALVRARMRVGELGLAVTDGQLYYEVCRVLLPLHHAPARPGFLLPLPLSRSAFDAALARTGGPAALPDRVRVAAGQPADAPDLFAYALPRLLVCQHDDLAAMLVANDLHMESATAVIGGADEPPQRLRAALAAATRPTVHLLHDATAAGAAWRDDSAPDWRPARVVAMGLRPGQARMLHLFRAPSGGAELAAVPPAHLLRVVRRLLAGRTRRREPTTSVRSRADLGFLSWPREQP